MSAYLTETDSVELSVLHVITRDEQLFEYLALKIQSEVQAYQPGLTKKAKGLPGSALPGKKLMGITGSIIPNDMLYMEMKFKDFSYVSEHFSLNQPITYLINCIESTVDYTKESSLLIATLKFTKVLSQIKFCGTRSAQKLYTKL